MKKLLGLSGIFSLVFSLVFFAPAVSAQTTIKGGTVITGGTGGGGVSGLATYSKIGTVAGGVCYVSPYTITTDAFAAMNACSSQLPAAGGVIDATALGTSNYTVSTPLTALNNASQAVSLVLNPGTTFTINTSFATPTNSPAFSAVPVGNNSAIIVLGSVPLHANFIAGSSARVWDLVSNGDFTGAQQAVRLDGVQIQGNSAATISGALLHVQGIAYQARIANSSTQLCYAQCVELDAGTPTVTRDVRILLDGDFFTDGATAGTYPGSILRVDALSSAGGVGHIVFMGGGILFNGPHNPMVVVNGRGSAQVNSLAFINTQFNTAPATTSGSNSNVDPLQFTDVSQVYFSNLHVSGNTNSGAQANLVDISQTAANLSYGFNLNQVSTLTVAGFTCLVNNTIEDTCETGYPSAGSGGDTVLPDYTYGQIVPQVRQTTYAPPTTPGQCVVGSIWTNSSGTNATNTIYVCQGNPGSQAYVAIGSGGGGGGGVVESGTAYQLGQFPSTGTVIGPTPSTYELVPGMNLSQINSLFSGLQSSGGTVIVPDGFPQTAWTNTNAQVVDFRKNANYVPITRYGVSCDASAFSLSITSGSNQVNVGSNFGAEAIGKYLNFGYRSGYQLGATQATWTAQITAYTYPYATLSANAPFSFSGWATFGTDNTANVQKALNDVGYNYPLSIPSGCRMLVLKPLQWNNGQSIIGQQMAYGGFGGGPAQDILQQPDASGQGSATSPGVQLKNIAFGMDASVDPTLGYTSYSATGTSTTVPALYRPVDVHMPNSAYPCGPGWITGSCVNGVASTTQNSAVMCYSTASGQKAPTAGQTIIFPYFASVFTTTVSSLTGAGCSGATAAATLAAPLPNTAGYTSAQAEWFAGTAVQTTATTLPVSMTYPYTLTLNLATTPVAGFPANFPTHGHVKILGNEFDYLGVSYASPYSIILRKGPATLTSCNGSGGTCVNSGATVVPLNPCPAKNIFGSTSDAPWPVTPTVNGSGLTPAGAAYFPGLCGGAAAISFPEADAAVFAQNGLTYSFLTQLQFGVDANINPNQSGTMAIYTAGATQPYKTEFHGIQNDNLEFGIVQGPASMNQHGVAAFGLTGTGNDFRDITNHAAYPLTFVGTSQGNLDITDNYSTAYSPYDGSAIGASTCLTYGFTLDDWTGSLVTDVNQMHTDNYNCEPEAGNKQEIAPATQLFGYQMLYSQDLFEGGYNIVGGAYQTFENGQWANPVVNYGQNNSWRDLTGLNNAYMTNTWGGPDIQFINWGTASTCSTYGGGQNGPQTICSPGMVQSYDGHSMDAAEKGTFLSGHPHENSQGGQIAPGEWNANASYDPFPMSVGYTADPTELYWGSYAACNVSGSAQCQPQHFDGFNGFLYIGPHQRIVDGSYILAGNFRTVSAPSAVAMYIGAYDSGTGQCGTTGQIAAYTINTTTSWAPQVFGPFSFSGRAGCILSVTFGTASTTDQLQVGFFDFVPVPQWQLLQVATYTSGAACTPNGAMLGSDTTNLYMCAAGTVKVLPFGGGGGGGGSFSALTSGTNSTAAMVVTSGASLTFSGSGTINASSAATATTAAGPTGTPTLCSSGQAATGVGASFAAQGCTTYLQGSLTATFIPVATGPAALTNSLATDDGHTFSYTGSGGLQVTSATPGKLALIAGTGSIPALPNNSAGFAAPTSGGTPYLIKFPNTISQGAPILAAPGTNDGVNESIMSVERIPHEFTSGFSQTGSLGTTVQVAGFKATNAGTLTNLHVAYGGPTCTTGEAYSFNVAGSNVGTVATQHLTFDAPGTAVDVTQSGVNFTAGQQVAIVTSTQGNCTGYVLVTGTYLDP